MRSEDEHNNGSGGSRSSIDEIARVFGLTVADINQIMIRQYEQTIRPMILTDIQAEHQKILSQLKEEFGLDLLMSMTGVEITQIMIRKYEQTIRPMVLTNVQAEQQSQIKEGFGLESMIGNFGDMASTSGSQNLQLQFINGISTPVSTKMYIEGKDHKPVLVALVDSISGQIVKTGAASKAGVEIVVLKGDCDDNEVENWTRDDFNNKIVGEWNGKKILQGNTYLNLKDGVGSVSMISFTHNSVWKKNNKCRLGARFENDVLATNVKEAKTESFLVRDKRSFLYNKHQIPSSSDNLWRIKKISKRSACLDRLTKAHIKTVGDFHTILAINPKRLKDILCVSPKKWKVINNHVRMCKDDKGVYLYRYPRDGQKINGVAFNLSGQLVGSITESCLFLSDRLSDDKKADAEKLIVSSSGNWGEVVSFNDTASLINYHHLSTIFNSPESPINDLNLSEATAPIFPMGCTHNVTNWGHDGSMAQTHGPKRSAYEPSMSNSRKKPRDDHHPQMSASRTTSMNVTEDDEEYLKYIDFAQYNLQKAHATKQWKTVLRVVEWISVVSKKCKRRTTIVIECSNLG